MRATPRVIAALTTLVLVATLAIVRDQGRGASESDRLSRARPAPGPAAPREPTARELRRLAFIAYEDDRWAECLDYLDKARSVDPAGDTTDKVQTARRFSEEQSSKRKVGVSGDGSTLPRPTPTR